MILSEYDAAMVSIEADAKRVDNTHVGDEYAVTLDAEMLAELNVERKLEAEGELLTARFNTVCGCNLPWLTDDEQAELDAKNDEYEDDTPAGVIIDPSFSEPTLTSDEEDAEVGRLWGIDASRVEFGE